MTPAGARRTGRERIATAFATQLPAIGADDLHTPARFTRFFRVSRYLLGPNGAATSEFGDRCSNEIELHSYSSDSSEVSTSAICSNQPGCYRIASEPAQPPPYLVIEPAKPRQRAPGLPQSRTDRFRSLIHQIAAGAAPIPIGRRLVSEMGMR
jgi:hypothetical protein